MQIIKRLEGSIGMIAAVVAGVLVVTLSAGAATTISTSINTEGAIAASSTLTALGDINTAGDFNAGGTIAASSTLTVTGASTLTGAILASSTAKIDGLFQTFAAVTLGDQSGDSVLINGALTASSTAAFSSTISVSATSTLATSTVNRLLAVASTTVSQNIGEVVIDGTATTSIILSNNAAATVGTCIQMESTAGENVRLYVPVGGASLIVEAGRCK